MCVCVCVCVCVCSRPSCALNMAKLTVAFRNLTNAPKTKREMICGLEVTGNETVRVRESSTKGQTFSYYQILHSAFRRTFIL